MKPAGGGRGHLGESPPPSSLPADAPEPENAAQRTTPSAGANATVGEGTFSERFPSYVRRKNTGAGENEEGGERETEKGYVGGGSFVLAQSAVIHRVEAMVVGSW